MKIDFHVHSIESYDGTATLCQIAESAKAAGIDGVFITDHNNITLDEPVNMNGVWLLPGCEISCKHAHIQALMFDKRFDLPVYDKAKLPEPEDMIKLIHEAGGIAVIAHPFAHPSKAKWDPRTLTVQPDGCEINNARGWMRNPSCNEEAKVYAEEMKLFVTGGSDGHLKDEVGHAYADVDCSGPEDMKAALLAKKSKSYLNVNTKRICKGWSQFEKYKREGRIFKGIVFLIKSWGLDVLGK